MAVGDALGEVGGVFGDIFSGTIGITFWIMIILLMVIVFGGVGWYFLYYRKRFDILVKVISERAGVNNVYFDRGAIIFDNKTNNTYLRLLKLKISRQVPKFLNFHHTNKGDYVELFRYSERGFRFLRPPVIDKKYIIRQDGKLWEMADIKQRQIEDDIAWIVQREKTNKKLIDPESLLMKLLAYTPQIISAIISLMILWMVLRYAPELLGAMKGFAQQIQEGGKSEVIGGIILAMLKWKKKL